MEWLLTGRQIFDQGNKRFGAVKRIDTTTNLTSPTF